MKAKGAKAQQAAFDRFCAANEILPLTDEIIVRAAEIYADLHQCGALISDADILIAASALVHGLALITSNEEHFKRITGLKVETGSSKETLPRHVRWNMQKYRIETAISKDGTLTIKGLAFRAGDKVEVIVRLRERARESSVRYPLRGKPIRYIDPFGSVAENEWDMLQ